MCYAGSVHAVRTRHYEHYQLQQLLQLVDHTDELDLPVCVDHRDKPDFVVSTRSRTIGLETTSFTDEEVMRASDLHDKRYPKAFVVMSGLRDGEVQLISGPFCCLVG